MMRFKAVRPKSDQKADNIVPGSESSYFRISVQFNGRTITLVKYYPPKVDLNIITQHMTFKPKSKQYSI